MQAQAFFLKKKDKWSRIESGWRDLGGDRESGWNGKSGRSEHERWSCTHANETARPRSCSTYQQTLPAAGVALLGRQRSGARRTLTEEPPGLAPDHQLRRTWRMETASQHRSSASCALPAGFPLDGITHLKLFPDDAFLIRRRRFEDGVLLTEVQR